MRRDATSYWRPFIPDRRMIVNRRNLLKLSLASSGLLATAGARAQTACATDGTPAQFIPKKAADPRPFENDLEKSPKCPYCGMDRRQFHHSRMLLQYSDNLPDGVCSLRLLRRDHLAVNVNRSRRTSGSPTTRQAPRSSRCSS